MAELVEHKMTHACPHCGVENTYTAPLDQGSPTPPAEGDCTICFYCLGVGVFDGDDLRVPSAKEAEKMKDNIDLQLALAMLKMMKAGKDA